MENQTLIIINLVISAIMPIIANSMQECWKFANRVKLSKCCGNEIILNENKKEDKV